MVQGDACLTQDESSCDTMELSPDKQPLQANGHVLSTEEENSCEPTATPDPPSGKEEADRTPSGEACVGKGSTGVPALQECVNGNESLDSMDSETNGKETEGGGKEVTAGLESVTGGEVVQKPAEHKESSEVMCVADYEKEGSSKEKNCASGPSEEQQSAVSTDTLEEAAQIPPPPALVVDHQRLKGLLEQVVSKSAGYSVEHLERLYSGLSQCIYQHRRDYDKTRLIEAMEKKVQHFETFL